MIATSNNPLFSPVKIGAFSLKHRIVLPPLSRLRAHYPTAVPSDLMRDYYAQRASDGGLVIAEATAVSSAARSYHSAPGLYSDEQVAGWKQVTDAVHAKGGLAVVQLTHAGRATSVLLSGAQPVSASVNPDFLDNKDVVVTTPDGLTSPSAHRALDVSEIHAIIDQFRTAAENARRAGFDGVEILAGQGHLVEQFLQNSSNKRTDEYGGSIENRARFLFEIVGTVSKVWGADRIGVRISPSSTFNGMGDSDPRALFRGVAKGLNDYGIAYLHVIEPRISGDYAITEGQEPVASQELSKIFSGSVIAAGGFTPQSAEAAVAEGLADAISIGRHFTSNPDLPFRIQHDLPLTPYDRSTFYAFDAKGYSDWKSYEFKDERKVA
jgi:N-ethylmaleimide reductase